MTGASTQTAGHVDLKAVKTAMAALKVKTKHADAESRVVELAADFETMLDSLNIESFSEDEPAMCDEWLVEILEPESFRDTVKAKLQRTCFKRPKFSVPAFLHWVQSPLSNGLEFEKHLPKTHGSGSTKPSGSKFGSSDQKSPSSETKPEGTKPAVREAPPGDGARLCFKCGSVDHTVFNCSDATQDEARKLYEANCQDQGQEGW